MPSCDRRDLSDVLGASMERVMVRGKKPIATFAALLACFIATFVAVLAWTVDPALASEHARHNPNGFRLTTSTLTVPQAAGQATFTIVRKNTRPSAQIRYMTLRGTAA